MKVALLSFHKFDEVMGGSELFTEHLKRVFPDLVHITYSNARGIRLLPNLERLNLEQPRMGMAISRKARKLIRKEEFDLIISNSTAGWWLSFRPPDVPMMTVFHFTMKGLAEQTLRNTEGYLPSRYLNPFFERATSRHMECFAVSHKVKRELEQMYGIGSTVIENGIDPDRFIPVEKEEARKALGIHEEGPIALFVGRADHTKGFDVVTEVARRRPDLRILCIIPNMVEVAGMRVASNVPNDKMPLYYSAADVLLFPTRYESFGYTALEAMSCDRPVVTSRTGIFEDLDDPRVGAVLEGHDPEEYCMAIDDVLGGPSRHPRELVKERFSLERFVLGYRNAAEELVSRGAELGPPSPLASRS